MCVSILGSRSFSSVLTDRGMFLCLWNPASVQSFLSAVDHHFFEMFLCTHSEIIFRFQTLFYLKLDAYLCFNLIWCYVVCVSI